MHRRRPLIWTAALTVVVVLGSVASAQELLIATLDNPSLELADELGRPVGWAFVAQPQNQQTVTLDAVDPNHAQYSALLDCSNAANEFTNLMQALDATGYQGKRVRFRAAVRTADLAATARVQLWFRVDREGGMGAFDNMQDRPIQSADWQHFDIVLDVADDATRLNVGMFVIGQGKAWIDDASLEPVEQEVSTTSMISNESLSAAMAAAGDAPVQPFFNHWLWLALIGGGLFVLSQVGFANEGLKTGEAGGGAENGVATATPLGGLPRFALRFTLLYWLFYSLPLPFTAITPGFLRPVINAYTSASDAVVRWAGAHVFGIEGEMVAPNGSGDTTYAYVTLLVCFVLALVVATVWSLIDRRKTDGRVTNDLLRSYLRYVLAATMIGYGLAKIGFIRNQFPSPGEFQLDRTFGDASPMGLLWTFSTLR